MNLPVEVQLGLGAEEHGEEPQLQDVVEVELGGRSLLLGFLWLERVGN